MADETPLEDGSQDETPQTGAGAASGPGGRIERLDIAAEMQQSYLTYAMSVIISRALPDVRDGLKPSQRRILVAMNDLNLGPELRPDEVREDLRRHQRQLSPARRSGRSIPRWSAWPRTG